MLRAVKINGWTKAVTYLELPDWYKLKEIAAFLSPGKEEMGDLGYTVMQANQLQITKQGNRCRVLIQDSNPPRNAPIWLYKGISMPISGIGIVADYDFQYGDYQSTNQHPRDIVPLLDFMGR